MRSSEQALADVMGRIAAACARSGRNPGDVRLVAVSKTMAAERVRELIQAGHLLFGENRVQEALLKIDAVEPGPEWHFIGHLQKNKIRHAIGKFALIHSVDGQEMALVLDRRCRAEGMVQPVLLQVNQAAETTKHGIRPEDLPALAAEVEGCAGLDLQGLMSIPPPEKNPEDSRRWFAGLRTLRDRLGPELGRELPELSMGMSDSYPLAVEEGATLVRVGTALFGSRQV
ncbi:MAG: YggS family pyridoxal phosphate-dependent enzyme [Acidobacteria bacterium]|uniref:Pyridoxal phosphate homeostasis protein n=1 Tax=Candidatus Polarisedimenticola svalbardensis TaxID=2886004 RepID=A0A8J7C252_9BACT|nr:YggS family pyridoxal phosphate-dependent enzyme [Candidatus Polarisedimenticola svalbardensis]